MPYSKEAAEKQTEEYVNASSGLRDLMMDCLRQLEHTGSPASKEHLRHGAARRLGVMHRAMRNVFTLFPLTSERPLPMETVHDVQINLHAFVMNLYGVFENFAWAFVHRHDLIAAIGGQRMDVSMFKRATQNRLPLPVTEYLTSEKLVQWHGEYLKNYRDALAHRIPLYIPPMLLKADEAERYSALEAEKREKILGKMDWNRIDAISEEQDALGTPCFSFIHSLEDGTRDLLIHPQLICDSLTVIEFGRLFFFSWHEHR
ncbi:hypothetical protein ABH945_001772 [Paraburkholderia sp. GAS333]|uniref:hypothetical protein n=1 Tax=Paraburkholderia sp. GAS333 TaxID=3156279 RepID=UPI003D1FF021